MERKWNKALTLSTSCFCFFLPSHPMINHHWQSIYRWLRCRIYPSLLFLGGYFLFFLPSFCSYPLTTNTRCSQSWEFLRVLRRTFMRDCCYYFQRCCADLLDIVTVNISCPKFHPFFFLFSIWWVSPRGVIANILDCEFELQSRYYVHFRTNTLGKGINSLIPTSMG